MAYQSDPAAEAWRNKSIIAQTAAKVASELTIAGLYDDTANAYQAFVDWQKVVYDATLTLVGEPVVAARPVAVPGPGPAQPQRAGDGLPYGSTEIKFGKFKGMTIEQIDNAVDSDGKPGTEYLEWLARESNQEFVKKAVTGYLQAKG